ncbi:MAG: DivIVA domain-containing protein [Clostridia bacterium]|nr:DivIVA domain-containing protein [Clostridia bacterium]
MLNPDAIQKKEFEQSVLGGYRRDEVDAFLDEIEVDYRKLYVENTELVEKLKVCLAKIEDYKKDEEFLKTAIINAQRLNETTLKEIEMREKEVELSAKEKAAEIISAAEKEAEEIVKKAEEETADAVRTAQEKCKNEIAAERKIADDSIAKIRSEVDFEQNKLDVLRGQVAEFKNTIIELYKAHLTSISKLPEFKASEPVVKEEPAAPVQKAEPAPASEPAKEEPVVEPAVQIENKEINENTVEFKVQEKQKDVSNEEDKYAAKQIRFENLKFGVDYDINKDE